MLRSLRFRPFRTLQAALILFGGLFLGTCTEGRDPAGLLVESHLLLALNPVTLAELAPDGVRPIERIRLTAVEVPGGTFLGGSTFEVDPGAQEWTLDFSIAIPAGSSAVVTLSVELLSFSTGSQLTEWSGRVGPLTLQVGIPTEVRDVPLFKGPLANISVTGVAIQGPPPSLREGQTVQLSATASTTTPEDPPTIFWGSLNTGVATVSGTGLVQGVLPGLARIVATAGAAADTVTVTVLPRPASVALEPEGAVLDALGEEVVFQAAVLDPRGEPVPGDAVTWTVGNPEILQNLGNGAFRSVSRGVTTVSAASTLDPGVSLSAEVVVRQVVAAVDVTPEEAVVFIEETAQFQAVALDSNENPIVGMGFSWSTPDPGVASVDEDGLATGVEPGTATILAEAVSGVMGVVGAGTLAPTPGTTGVASLVVLPEVARVAVLPNPFTFRSLGQIQGFTARAYGLDESGQPTVPLPLTQFTWESLNENVIRVEGVGLTADTAFVGSVANGSTVLRATAYGITGSTPVFVAQRAVSYEINPSDWVFSCPDIPCIEREFSGRALDALGNRVPGIVFYWQTVDSCFPVLSPTGGAAESATVNDVCGCDASPEVLEARLNPDAAPVATATLYPPECLLPALGEFAMCRPARVPPGSPFRLVTGLPH